MAIFRRFLAIFSFFVHSVYTNVGILTKLAQNIRYGMENP